MRVWIDLSNSPHPLLFAPIARRLEELGHEVGVTARDNAQTVELTLERWPHATIIGGQSPRSRANKAKVMIERVRALRRWARGFCADVALSHNSYGQIVAARSLGLRVVTAMDYEGQPANHLAFRLAHTILMPEALRGSRVHKQGATHARAHFYPGFKEEIYLGDFDPDLNVLGSIGIERSDHSLVVARTPPSRAAYHRFDSPLFEQTIEALGRKANTHVVVLARHTEQREALRSLGLTNVVVPDHAIDARSLMYEADLVLGAGGTMTREAALMGLPTYSVFAGEQPAVDRQLERQGHLKRARSVHQMANVRQRASEPHSISELRARATELVDRFVEAVLGPRASSHNSGCAQSMNQTGRRSWRRGAASHLDVAIVGPIAPPRGGISAHVERLASLLQADGLKVGIIDHFTNTNHTLVVAQMRRNPVRYWTHMRRLRAPVVHYHHARWSTLMAAALARRRRHCHSIWLVTFHGHGIERSLMRRIPMVAALTRWAVKRFDRVITVSEAVGSVVRRETGSDVTVIPAYLPFDQSREVQGSRASAAHPTAIVAAYRVAARRSEDLYGLDFASAVFASASTFVPDLHFKFFFAQPPRNAKERRYLAQIVAPLKRAGLEQRFTVEVGAELTPAFQPGAIYLRTTRTDGDAVSIREALSVGIPVLASDVVARPNGTVQLPLNDAPAWVFALRHAIASRHLPSSVSVSPDTSTTHETDGGALLRLYQELCPASLGPPADNREEHHVTP
jgi:uncharacterized protein